MPPRRVEGALAFSILLGLGLLAPGARSAEPLHPIPAVLHVHSTWSTGDQTLAELAARAGARGIEAVFLTENYLLQFEYGLPPLRGLLRYRVDLPSLSRTSPEAFLAAVAAINAHQRAVLFIPGADVTPHYFWTGHPLQGTLTNHNGQKNLLALGLDRVADYRQLPMVGNAEASPWGLRSLWLLSPILLVIPGVLLIRTRRRRIVRTQYFRLVEERRLMAPGIVCFGVAALLLANNYPFRSAPVSPYDTTAGLRPHQAMIDYVNARGGVAVWKLPEARDYHEVTVAGLRATIQTQPYPEDLLQTDRFDAFGGLYEDTITFTLPGNGWDRLLLDSLNGLRRRPAWAIAESAYHSEGHAGKRLGDVLTVLLAPRKDASALLQALREGRMYALRRTSAEALALEQFQVWTPDQPPVEAGARLAVAPSDPVEVRVRIGSAGGSRVPVEAHLIRSGQVVHTVRGETPLEVQWSEPPSLATPRAFYRLDVRGPTPHQILSNPIFVERAGGVRL